MAGVINFVEEQRQVYLHDFLVYVCGVDISAHVKELRITYTDKSAPGSVDISLSNPFDQWILTEANFAGNWRRTNDRYTEEEKYQIFQNKKNLSIQSVAGKLDKVSAVKQNSTYSNSVYGNYQAIQNNEAANQDFLQRYTFGPGSCVFSMMDTVKIFIKNPTDPVESDRWIPAFTGTVETKPFSTNFINGESQITLICYDIRAMLNHMRIGVNPYTNSSWQRGGPSASQRQQQVFVDQVSAGIFSDYYPSLKTGGADKDPRFDNIFQGKSFVNMMGMITCGQEGWISEPGNKLAPHKTGQGIGFFTPGKVYRYANPNFKNASGNNLITSLEEWDNLCLFGTYNNQIKNNTPNWLTFKDCDYIGKNSFWTSSALGSGTDAFTPLNGQVHFLIPAQGLNISDMISTSVNGIQNIMGTPEWSSRLSLINNACEMVDYDFSVTGSGDIIFEFPMYDFSPDNYGNNKSVYIGDKHVISEQISDEGGEVISAVEVQGASSQLVQEAINTAMKSSNPALALQEVPKRVAFSNFMVAKCGVRIASKTFTGVPISQLHVMATLELQKRLADANKMSIDLSYRPFLRPNRPFFHAERKRLGKTTQVSLNITPLREATVSMSLHCVRTPLLQGSGAEAQIVYQHVFGGEGMTLSYNTVFEAPDPLGKKQIAAQNKSGISNSVDTAKHSQ